MTPKEINDLKIKHNGLMEEGSALYERVLDLQEKITNIRHILEEAEGDDYDGVPLIFGSGYWIDESLK